MCGIIGYTGFRKADNVLIDCLKRLEYRGYDSAGIGVVDKKLQIFKEIGEISKLEKEIAKIQSIPKSDGTRFTFWEALSIINQQKENKHMEVIQRKIKNELSTKTYKN